MSLQFPVTPLGLLGCEHFCCFHGHLDLVFLHWLSLGLDAAVPCTTCAVVPKFSGGAGSATTRGTGFMGLLLLVGAQGPKDLYAAPVAGGSYVRCCH